jgi:hypothetical protein
MTGPDSKPSFGYCLAHGLFGGGYCPDCGVEAEEIEEGWIPLMVQGARDSDTRPKDGDAYGSTRE